MGSQSSKDECTAFAEESETLGDVKVFRAGTAMKGGMLVTSGGRALGVTAMGDDLPAAIKRAHKAVAKISFEGAHYRKDIAAKALKR